MASVYFKSVLSISPPSILVPLWARSKEIVADELPQLVSRDIPSVPKTSFTCRTCSLCFTSVNQQRLHFKDTQHIINLQNSRTQIAAVNSDTVSDDDDFESDEESLSAQTSELLSTSSSNTHQMQLFSSDNGSVLSVCKSFFPSSQPPLATLHSLQQPHVHPPPTASLSSSTIPTHTTICVLLLCGGYFASSIFQILSETRMATPYLITHSKTFKHYTVRRKQGGSQSARDNQQGGGSKSAGSQLRRHEEANLEREVRDLLSEWRMPLQCCRFIFVHSPGKFNERVVFGYDAAVLTKSAVHSIPMAIRRPCHAETIRLFEKLTTAHYFPKSMQTKE